MADKAIPLDDLVQALDRFFLLQSWPREAILSQWVSKVYDRIGYDHTRLFERSFCERYNGLMLRSGDEIADVYCAAFPCPEIIEHVLSTAAGKALLFLHHPIDMEVSGVGFLPILPDHLDRLRARGVSVYACHAPLDCHDEIGTNASIMQALGARVEQGCAPEPPGYAGRIGTIAPTTMEELAQRASSLFRVNRVEIGGARPALISGRRGRPRALCRG